MAVPVSVADEVAKDKAVIELAAKLRDWSTLEFAVDDMISHQRSVVVWWDEHVRPHGSNRHTLEIAGWQSLEVAKLERLLEIKDWQISRWRTALAKEEDYRDKIIEAACKKAGLRDKDPSATRGQRSGSMCGPIGTPSSRRRMISARRLVGSA